MTERKTGRLPQAFAQAFAAELNPMMDEAGLTGARLAELLSRSAGYVSERRNGKAAWTTDDLDVIGAELGTDALGLMDEVIGRMRERARTKVTPIRSADPKLSKPLYRVKDTTKLVAKRSSEAAGSSDFEE